jgi:hypothetical protein
VAADLPPRTSGGGLAGTQNGMHHLPAAALSSARVQTERERETAKKVQVPPPPKKKGIINSNKKIHAKYIGSS